jgi:hypothetical protein
LTRLRRAIKARRYSKALTETDLQASVISDRLATEAGCQLISVEMFDQNEGALRFYPRLGYSIVEKRPVIQHPCHPCNGDIILLTENVIKDGVDGL